MSIPLDRLYHYVEKIFERAHGDNVIIYRFFPHGSKKFTDLTPLRTVPLSWKEKKLRPQMFCNDQEPLNYSLYEHIPEDQLALSEVLINIKAHGLIIPRKNFRTETFTIWDKALLLHSEQRSIDVEIYKNNDFLPIYYWSHAVISQDWFRYARHVEQEKNVTKTFLIYSRGWTGTREYRLKFLEMLVTNNLNNQSLASIQPVDAETLVHYSQHKFKNIQWKPDVNLENYFITNNIGSDYSADFEIQDYEHTHIEVVLETLFDDHRLHFTEKILRPIALGQPFILMGTHGGLEYLKNYGFKTFGDVWSEDYDTIVDPVERMQSVIETMKYITNLEQENKLAMISKANQIAKHNKERFFSQEFYQQVIGELNTNIQSAVTELKNTNIGQTWYDIRENFADNQPVQMELEKIRSKQETDDVFDILMQYRRRNK